MPPRTFPLCSALVLIAACGSESAAPSAEQDHELNGAAEMLNEAPESLSNVDDSSVLPEPEAEQADREE